MEIRRRRLSLVRFCADIVVAYGRVASADGHGGLTAVEMVKYAVRG